MIRTAIVGATGVVGQQFVLALRGHPWFAVTALAASEQSAGKTYRQALTDAKTGALRWYCDEPPPATALDMPVATVDRLDLGAIDLVFTGIESDAAKELEPRMAATAPVISTASAFRYEADVPILIPGVNDAHAALLRRQQKERGWKGFVVPIPNCTTTGLATTLKPLAERFGLTRVLMTSMQAVSGAGRSPGVLSLDILDNVIPFIAKEEEKVAIETQKILGALANGAIKPLDLPVSCTCTRVNVKDGHTEAVFASTVRPASVDDVKKAFRDYAGRLADSGLPSAPREAIVVHEDPYRPQPRLDREAYGGMAVTVGRIRRDDALENGVKYVLVSHNTKLGAAKGAVLTAEVLVRDGYIKR